MLSSSPFHEENPAPDDLTAVLLSNLGYTVDPVIWDTGDFPQSVRGAIAQMRLLCTFGSSASPFRIFEIELRKPTPLRRLLDPICRLTPQVDHTFILRTPPDTALVLVNPVPRIDFVSGMRYRRLKVRPRQTSWFAQTLLSSLRLSPGDAERADIGRIHRRTFDELERFVTEEAAVLSELDPMRLLLVDLEQFPVLPNHEQVRLAVVAQSLGPDAEAAKRNLVAHNIRLVISVARKHQNQGVDLCDLVQEGVLGLLRTIRTFDASRGFHFSTYAHYWIRQYILRCIGNYSHTIRLPVHKHDELSTLRVAERSFCKDVGREPSDIELALLTRSGKLSDSDCAHGWTWLIEGTRPPYAVERRIMKAAFGVADGRLLFREPLSLDDPVADVLPQDLEAILAELDPDEMTPADLLPCKHAPVDEVVDQQLLVRLVRDLMTGLKPSQRAVLEARYGLDGNGGSTLETIGDQMKVTRERIRQIESKALSRFRRPQVVSRLRGYIAENHAAEDSDATDLPKRGTPKLETIETVAGHPPVILGWSHITQKLRMMADDSPAPYIPSSIELCLSQLPDGDDANEEED